MACKDNEHINVLLHDIIGAQDGMQCFYADNFWTQVHLGWDWRGNASWGQWHHWFLQLQPDAKDASQDALCCTIPSLLSLYLCHQQWLGSWDGPCTSPGLRGNIHQTSVSWQWKLCWFPGMSWQGCSMTVQSVFYPTMTIMLCKLTWQLQEVLLVT